MERKAKRKEFLRVIQNDSTKYKICDFILLHLLV